MSKKRLSSINVSWNSQWLLRDDVNCNKYSIMYIFTISIKIKNYGPFSTFSQAPFHSPSLTPSHLEQQRAIKHALCLSDRVSQSSRSSGSVSSATRIFGVASSASRIFGGGQGSHLRSQATWILSSGELDRRDTKSTYQFVLRFYFVFESSYEEYIDKINEREASCLNTLFLITTGKIC